MAKAQPDLKPYVGRKLPVIARIWARTVKSPKPAIANVDVPLASTFMLSAKGGGEEAYVEAVIENGTYRFTVKAGKPKDGAQNATKTGGRGANFLCLRSQTPISGDYIKAEGMAGRIPDSVAQELERRVRADLRKTGDFSRIRCAPVRAGWCERDSYA